MIFIKMKFTLLIVLLINFQVLHGLSAEDNQNGEEHESPDSSDQMCEPDEIIDIFTEIFTPEDYEEGKNNIKSNIGSLNETLIAMNRLQEFGRNVSQKMSEFTKRMSSRLSESLMTIALPPDCMNSMVRIMSAAQNGELWALKFFDSQPRPSNGMIELSGIPTGDYDQCLSIESPDEENKPKIFGQYCGIDMQQFMVLDPKQYSPELFANINRNDTFGGKLFNRMFSNLVRPFPRRTYEDWLSLIRFFEANTKKSFFIFGGLCLPTTCRSSDVSKALNELIYPMTRIPLQLTDECEYATKPVRLDIYQIISMIGLGSVFMVFLLSSIIDCTSITSKMFEKTSLDFYIKCFSVKRNIKSVFSVKQYGKFKCLDGFRAILTFQVVLTHNYEFGLLFLENKNHYQSASYKMTQDFRNMWLPNILLMDNFIIISAFLLGNTILSKLEQSKGQFNYINYLIFRYLRIIPIIIFGLFCTFLFSLVGDGPFWKLATELFVNVCYDKWYKPLLMYNNVLYYPTENSTVKSSIQCMTITWYSSCDFQLYALAPISFLLLYKRPKFGVIWNIVLLVIAVLLPLFNRFVLNYPHAYEILSTSNFEILMDGWGVHYWGPINYIQTYIIGILLAYVVRHKPNVYLGGRIGELFIWCLTIFMTTLIMYWQRTFTVPGYFIEGFFGYELHVYLLFHKLFYVSAFAWLIFACATGRGGFVNKILGWKGFKFVDNMSLEIYIIHTFFFVYRIGVRRDQTTITDYSVWTSAVFDYVASYMISVIVSLAITRPFANMTMILMKPKRNAKQIDEKNNGKSSDFSNPFPILNQKLIKDLNVVYHSNDKIVYRL